MGRTFRTIEFDEDHAGGQKLIECYNRTCDYTTIIYVDENGEAHEMFGGSDPMIEALLKIVQNRNCRHSTQEEIGVARVAMGND